jgi:predicted dehydrogenase
MEPIKVLVVGCGHMGSSHARAYKKNKHFKIAGLVSPGPDCQKLAEELEITEQFSNYEEALSVTRPDAVSINTYPDTHADYTIKALNCGSHVFVEKPIARTVSEAEKVIETAKRTGKKLVVGYILRQHPSWIKFIELAHTLGKPLVMRMNLNQQSHGDEWNTHKNLMKTLSPIVDCGVHYVDVMCQMTRSRPLRVSAVGARLTNELAPGMYNYGQLQVTFADGSVGWYEAGWGPMISENAYFIKDVIGPDGAVSIVAAKNTTSDNVDSHTKTDRLLIHSGKLDRNNNFVEPDKIIDMTDEPGHQDLCDREQQFFYNAVSQNLDLSDHWEDAVNSMKIVLAADEAFKTGKTIEL